MFKLKKTAQKLLFAALCLTWPVVALAECPSYQNHEFRKLHSKEVINLCKVTRDKAVLFVNTASHCGYTRQYSGLEKISQQYRQQALVVVGFASNDFNQESKDEAESANICYVNHGVTFTVFAATPVKGDNANPIFAELASQSKAPNWNFNKYLVDKNGKLVQHFSSGVEPDSKKMHRAIASVLSE